VLEIVTYVDESGKSHFEDWFNKLNPINAAKIASAMYKLEQGNFSNVKGIGKGIYEYKVHFGPGFRIYFGRDGESVIILLAGGTKRRQQKDIDFAVKSWEAYKARKKKTG